MTDGIFTVRSTYNELVCQNNSPNIPLFNSIWHWKGLERIISLLQKIGQLCIMINHRRWRMGVVEFSTCPLCHNHDETILYIERLTHWSNHMATVFTPNQCVFFFSGDLVSWVNHNQTFGMILDQIWRRRNIYIFHNMWISNTTNKGRVDTYILEGDEFF